MLTRVRGSTLHIPVGATTTVIRVTQKAEAIKVSLQTRDPEEAKARHAAVHVYLGNVYATYRVEKPVRLTREQ